MNASGNGDAPRGDNWINAIAGRLSPTGENSFRDALRQFADQPVWCGDADLRTKITEQLRTLTKADASKLADCIPTSSRDQALEHALIAARRRHLSQHDAEDTDAASLREWRAGNQHCEATSGPCCLASCTRRRNASSTKSIHQPQSLWSLRWTSAESASH